MLASEIVRMLFDKFVEETRSWWSTYLRAVSKAQREGRLDSRGNNILYPNILLVTNCSGYYVAELVGATEKFEPLSVKRHEEKSIYRYLSQFDDSDSAPLFHLDAACHGMRSLCLAHDADFDRIKKRFPQIELYGSKIIGSGGTEAQLRLEITLSLA